MRRLETLVRSNAEAGTSGVFAKLGNKRKTDLVRLAAPPQNVSEGARSNLRNKVLLRTWQAFVCLV